MRRHLRALSLLVVTLWLASPATAAFAGTYVLDDADIIDAATEARIETVSARIEESTPGAEIAVVTVDSLDGREIEEYAEEKFDELGVGSAELDNGVLLLVAPTERRVRIEVGYGLEGAIPDARAGRIIDDVILPAFRAGDMAGGIEQGHAEIARLILAEYGESTEGLPQAKKDAAMPFWQFLLIMIAVIGGVVVLIGWLGSRAMKSGGGGGWTPPRGGSTWGGSSGSGSSGGSSSGSSSSGGGGGGFGGGGSGGGGASGGW